MVFPVRYSYRADELENTDVDSNCEENTAGVVTCQHPGVLTDSQLGPAQFDADDSGVYYHWNKDRNSQILFTFEEDVVIYVYSLTYYSSQDDGIALPKTNLNLVDRNFTVTDSHGVLPSLTSSQDFGQSGTNVLINTSRVLLPLFRNRTAQVLLRIDRDKEYALALTEVKFCTRRWIQV